MIMIEVLALQCLRQQATKEKFIRFVINVNNDTSGVVHHLFDRQLYSSTLLPEVNKEQIRCVRTSNDIISQ